MSYLRSSSRLIVLSSTLLFITALTSCGGGGGGDAVTAAKVEISGTIKAPGGTVSADNPLGLKEEANKLVSLFRIDNEGNVIGDVLDSTTSDQDGQYVLLLPAGVEISSDLIIKAKIGDGPSGIEAFAIVFDPTTDITPISTYIAEKLIANPDLDMSSLPSEEVSRLIEFIETLPLVAEADLGTMLTQIASTSDIAIEPEIEDLAASSSQVRLSGLLAAASGINAGQTIEAVKIDNDGNPVGAVQATTTTNDAGVFTILLAAGQSLSGGVMLTTAEGTKALAVEDQITIDVKSTYTADEIIDSDIPPEDIPLDVAISLGETVNGGDDCTTDNLTDCIAELELDVGAEVDAQGADYVATIAATPGVYGSTNWGQSTFQ
jgi:hypothetical protein